MQNQTKQSEQGHWILASLGKKVLRPGGKKLTTQIIDALSIQHTDTVVEFAPGIGLTASLLLHQKPKSYFGIELNEAAAKNLTQKFKGLNIAFINESAANTGLENETANKVIGEAMLTMQADNRKLEIIKEAYRILKPGGLYAIHELGLYPENITAEIKKDMLFNLAKTIKVNARPLTQQEWCTLLEKEGFKIVEVFTQPMLLMNLRRIIKDEGLFSTFKFVMNVLTHPQSKQKVLAIKNVFKKYKNQLTAIGIIAQKK